MTERIAKIILGLCYLFLVLMTLWVSINIGHEIKADMVCNAFGYEGGKTVGFWGKGITCYNTVPLEEIQELLNISEGGE
jgi:hypothetical protein